MMWSENLNWAFAKVIADWLKRLPKQNRTLPSNYTTPVLRLIRVNACRREAPKSFECAKWSQTKPYPAVYPSELAEPQGPFMRTGEFVCQQCNHPVVTNEKLIGKLHLGEKNPKFDERTLRRYLNDGDPIPVDQFRRAVANGFGQGLLGVWQTVAIWEHINRLDATRKGLLALFRRVLERKAFRLRQEFDVSAQEIEQELTNQHRLLDHEETRALDQRLNDRNLPPEVRQILEEGLLARRQDATDQWGSEKK